MDDHELLRQYVTERDQAAFTELLARHFDLVYSAALRRVSGDQHGAAEVAQDVFLRLARRPPELTAELVLPAWLYVTTRHVAINYIRSESRRRKREAEAHMRQEANAGENSPADWELLRPQLDAAMDRLRDADRDAVLLRYFARQPFAEIGRALNLSEDAARMRVDRALQKLRQLLTKQGVTSTTAALSLALTSHAVAAAPAALQATVRTTLAASATAVSAGSAGLGLLQLMVNTKLALSVAVLAVAAAWLAVNQNYALRAEEASLTAAEQAHALQRAEVDSLERMVVTAEQEQARLQRELDAGKVAASAAPTPAPAPEWDPMAEGRAYLTRHPELKAARVAWRRAEIEALHSELWESLGLSAPQREAFIALVLNDAIPFRSVGNSSLIMALPAGDNTIPRVSSWEPLRALLGEEGLRRYQAVSLTASETRMTTRLGKVLMFSDTPLSAAQARELLQLARTARGPASGPRVAEWDDLVSQSPVLSAPQLKEFEEMRARDRANQAATAIPLPLPTK